MRQDAWNRDLLPENCSVQNGENLLKSHFRKDSNHEADEVHGAADWLCSGFALRQAEQGIAVEEVLGR